MLLSPTWTSAMSSRWRRWTVSGGLALGLSRLGTPLGLLVILMALDILAGLLTALLYGHPRLRILWRGLLRKSVSLLVILAGALLEQSLAVHGLTPVHITPAVTLFYVVHEVLSILEHTQLLGAPIPPPLQHFLQQLRTPRDHG